MGVCVCERDAWHHQKDAAMNRFVMLFVPNSWAIMIIQGFSGFKEKWMTTRREEDKLGMRQRLEMTTTIK